MVRIGGGIETGHVAGGAVLRCAVEASAGMALRALHGTVFPGERELGMSERRTLPLRGGVAEGAIGGEP